MERVFDLPMEKVDPAPVLLRPIDIYSIEYLEMVESLKKDGHLGNSILCRPIGERWEVVDGMYRYTAAKEARFKVIQSIVRDMTDEEVIVWQIKTNSIRKGTDPIEYARHLERLRRMNPDLSLKELAQKLGKNKQFLVETLQLNNLTSESEIAVKRGEITLGNAKLLAKLKDFLQPEFIDFAKKEKYRDFQRRIANAINDYREAIKMGKLDEFYNQAVKPYLRPIREIKDEMETWEQAGALLVKYDCKTPLDGWKIAVKWMMNMDPENLERRKCAKQKMELQKLAKKNLTNEGF